MRNAAFIVIRAPIPVINAKGPRSAYYLEMHMLGSESWIFQWEHVNRDGQRRPITSRLLNTRWAYETLKLISVRSMN